jgi:hypothetical protein
MTSHVLASVILLLHFAFVVFAVFGGFLVLCRRWVAWIHLPAVLWSSAVNLAGWVCPLTPLENRFRMAAGQAGYTDGFVEHYVAALVYPAGMTRTVALTAGISVVVWNVAVYAWVIARYRHRGGRG